MLSSCLPATPCGGGGYAGGKSSCPGKQWLVCWNGSAEVEADCYGLGDRDDCELHEQ